MPIRAAWLVTIVSALEVAVPVARADLSWDAPQNCPELPEMDTASSEVSLHARVLATDAGFEMVLTSAGGAMQQISASTCEELIEALVIIWNLANAPPSRDSVPIASFTAEPAAELATPEVEETGEVAVEQESSDPIEVGIALGAALDVGSTPGPAPGVALGFSLGASTFRIASTFTFFPPLSYASSEFGIEEGIFAAALDGCGFLFDDMVRIAGCGGLETGVAWASAIHVPLRATAYEPIFGFRAGIELIVSIAQWLGVRVDVFAMVPLLRPRFVVRDPESERSVTVHQPSELAFRGTLGLEVLFR